MSKYFINKSNAENIQKNAKPEGFLDMGTLSPTMHNPIAGQDQGAGGGSDPCQEIFGGFVEVSQKQYWDITQPK